MKFDEDYLFTCFNRWDVEEGSTGIFSNDLGSLMEQVENGEGLCKELKGVEQSKEEFYNVFTDEYGKEWQLFYLLGEPNRWLDRLKKEVEDVEQFLSTTIERMNKLESFLRDIDGDTECSVLDKLSKQHRLMLRAVDAVFDYKVAVTDRLLEAKEKEKKNGA